MKLTIYCDGGSRGNPGPSASAFVVFDENSNEVASEGVYLGISTNNVAEYTALIKALDWLKRQTVQPNEVTFIFDSELLVRQMNKIYKVKSPNLIPLFLQINATIKTLSYPITFNHVLRHDNKGADTLVNQTLDAHAS